MKVIASPDSGMLIVNADDWGRDGATTQRTLECHQKGAISSVSFMVFMEGSEQAATIAGACKIDSGLHLNLTTSFSGRHVPAALLRKQQLLSRSLLRHRLSQLIFHPELMKEFKYVVQAQIDEFCRIYGSDPDRIDGHHHMHLAANVVLQKLLPKGTTVRRNFSFRPREKGIVNFAYRRLMDALLARRHHVVDYFFSMPSQETPAAMHRILSLARKYFVEVEAHPAIPAEYQFLMGNDFSHVISGLAFARQYLVPGRGRTGKGHTDEC